MTDFNINSFQHFLEDLEKNLREMDAIQEKESMHLRRMHVLYEVMSKMCKNWKNQLEHQK